MKQLPQVKIKSGLESPVYKKIRQFFDDLLFDYLFEVIKDKKVFNSKGIISNLLSGWLSYDGKGHFYHRGKMPSSLAKEFEDLGAVWIRSLGCYGLPQARIPADILQAIAHVNIHNEENLQKIDSYLNALEDTKEYASDNLSFDIEVKDIGNNLDVQFKRSMETLGVVPPELTDYQLREIAKNYTNNLNKYIKKWTVQEINSLRKDVQQLTMQGYRSEAMENLILKHRNVSRNKAKFLARQETKLLVAEYRKNRFKQQGVTKYIWSTVLDGRERQLHKELNGRIFSWDNPPIIDANTGERGNPGEAYNCRCQAIPVVDEDFWES
jgi:SPP1 gp7 family putative phage head morphogenesis protein